MKILVVNDNMDDLGVVMNLLKSNNYQVQYALNGREALYLLESESFDIIVSDILMPVMDGFQLCRECKADHRLSMIPFVFYTATYVDKRDEEFALSIGARQFLRNPMEPDDIMKAIRNITDNHEGSLPESAAKIGSGEVDSFSLYSERLVNRLEKKSLDLQNQINRYRITEKNIRESGERLSLAVEGTSDGLWDWDIRTDETYCSDRYFEMLGYRPGEFNLTTRNWKEMIHPDDREGVQTMIKDYFTRKVSWYESVFRMKAKNGTYRWIIARGKALFDSHGKPFRFAGFITDITDKKLQELEFIKAREKSWESDRLKTAFLVNISHEIRNSMNGILGFIGLLKAEQIDPEAREQYITVVEKSCNRLLSIITDIVEISRIEANQITIRNVKVDIPMLINSICASFADHLPKEVEISMNMSMRPSAKGCICITDETKLKEILTRLIANAVKFTHSGAIETGCQFIKSNELEFYVKDTGIGIPEESQELIFENFRQGENIKALGMGGTGLGLSISKAYVKALGGRIWLRSEVGKGSVFYFTIPYLPPSKSQRQGSSHNSPGSKLDGKLVLVAEDDDSNYAFLEQLLYKNRVKILRATTGKEVINFCRSNPDIDLVLMDIQMPDMDGYEATKQIMTFHKKLPVIAQTAYAYHDDHLKAIASGCIDYIAKPINPDHLLNLLERYIGSDLT